MLVYTTIRRGSNFGASNRLFPISSSDTHTPPTACLPGLLGSPSPPLLARAQASILRARRSLGERVDRMSSSQRYDCWGNAYLKKEKVAVAIFFLAIKYPYFKCQAQNRKLLCMNICKSCRMYIRTEPHLLLYLLCTTILQGCG